eukprot:scaffold4899_cov377-Prasinococcus_capsulatus_cf.AAC.1
MSQACAAVPRAPGALAARRDNRCSITGHRKGRAAAPLVQVPLGPRSPRRSTLTASSSSSSSPSPPLPSAAISRPSISPSDLSGELWVHADKLLQTGDVCTLKVRAPPCASIEWLLGPVVSQFSSPCSLVTLLTNARPCRSRARTREGPWSTLMASRPSYRLVRWTPDAFSMAFHRYEWSEDKMLHPQGAGLLIPDCALAADCGYTTGRPSEGDGRPGRYREGEDRPT